MHSRKDSKQTPARDGELPELGEEQIHKMVEVGRVRTRNYPGGIDKLAGKARFQHQNLEGDDMESTVGQATGLSLSLTAELYL